MIVDNSHHSVQPLKDNYLLNYKFPNDDEKPCICNILCLPNGFLVASYKKESIIMTYSLNGKEKPCSTLKINSPAVKMTVVGKDTVMAILNPFEKLIVVIPSFQHKPVIKYINSDNNSWDPNLPLICIKQMLYIAVESNLIVRDMSGNIRNTIKLSFKPVDLCNDAQSGRIYCTNKDRSKLICIDMDGNSIFTLHFTDTNIGNPCSLTMDDDGNVIVLSEKKCCKFHVIKVDPDRKSTDLIITNLETNLNPLICFDRATQSIVIGCYDTFHVYRKKK